VQSDQSVLLDQLESLKGQQVSALIQYFDTDKQTIMHEKKAQGPVHQVHPEMGVVLAIDGNSNDLFKVPPLMEAFQFQLDGSYKVHWGVYRTQETRQDGEHEWWEWKPLSV